MVGIRYSVFIILIGIYNFVNRAKHVMLPMPSYLADSCIDQNITRWNIDDLVNQANLTDSNKGTKFIIMLS
jgi:hypothetical protein